MNVSCLYSLILVKTTKRTTRVGSKGKGKTR